MNLDKHLNKHLVKAALIVTPLMLYGIFYEWIVKTEKTLFLYDKLTSYLIFISLAGLISAVITELLFVKITRGNLRDVYILLLFLVVSFLYLIMIIVNIIVIYS